MGQKRGLAWLNPKKGQRGIVGLQREGQKMRYMKQMVEIAEKKSVR